MNRNRQPRTRFFLAALATALILGATSCELLLDVLVGSSDGGGGAIVPNEITLYSPYKIDFGIASAKTVTLSGLNANSVYLVKSNVSGYPTSAVETGSAVSSIASGRSIPEAPVTRTNTITDPISGNFGGVIRYDYQAASDFNANPPAIDRNNARSLVPISGTALFEYTQPGIDSRVFYVQNAAKAWITVTATLRAIGTHCYIWVPDLYYGPSVPNNDNKITEAQVNALKTKFDLIYPLETNVLGYEYGGNSHGGVDKDLHISILVYDINGDYNSDDTGGWFGYFWSKDFYTQEQLTSAGSTYQTNLAEMFYIDAHLTDINPDIMYSTLVHEFQHMINFNRKNIQQGISSPTWYNEMLSQLSEDMLNSQTVLELPLSASPIASRIPYFNAGYDLVGVTQWFDAAESPESQWKNLVSYSTSYAFGAYLVRNYGGADLMKAMLDNAATGESSISIALNTVNPFAFADTTSGFRNAYRRYAEAIVYSGSVPAGTKTLDKTVISEINGTSYTFPAIDIWNILNKSYDPETEFLISGQYGPSVWDIASTADMPPYSVSLLSSPEWQNVSSTLSITVNKPTDPDVELYVMIR